MKINDDVIVGSRQMMSAAIVDLDYKEGKAFIESNNKNWEPLALATEEARDAGQQEKEIKYVIIRLLPPPPAKRSRT